MSAELSQIVVTCAEEELTRFNIPAGLSPYAEAGSLHLIDSLLTGETCGSYARNFLTSAAGYLANPDATGNCGYCAMKTGAGYVATLGYSWSHKWRDWGKCDTSLRSSAEKS